MMKRVLTHSHRRKTIQHACLILFGLFLIILLACPKNQAENQPIPSPVESSSQPPGKKSRFGVQGAIAKFSSEMKEAGIEIIREWIVWQEIEPEKGRYNWEPMDVKVRAANQAGIEIIGYFITMPSWAKKGQKDLKPAKNNKGNDSDFCEPKDINDFRKFAKAVAERYDGKHDHGEMKYIEILNEITVPEFFEFKNPDNPYELWLVNGYQGIKEGNPDTKVLIGAFFDPIDSSSNPPRLSVKQFIERMLRDYTQQFDIVNFHSYSKESDGITKTTQYIKERMQAYKVNKSMWITETSTLIGFKPKDTQEQLEKEVLKRYARAFGEGVEKVFWYSFMTLPTPKENPEYGADSKFLGLGWDFPKNVGMDHKFHPRQAYYTYKLMASKLRGFSSAVKIADTQYRFIFADKNPVYVLWSNDDSLPLPAEITGSVKVTDYLGNEETKQASGVVLTKDPIFLE